MTVAPLADAAGVVHPPAPDARIASLVPSITELLFDLGLGPQVVARTAFCIHPRGAIASVPKVGGTKKVRLEAVRRLAPTHAIVNIDENTREIADALREFVPHVVVTHPVAPLDNVGLYRLLGAVFAREAEAEALAARFAAMYADVVATPWPEERVLYLVWRDPWIAVARDTYVSRMLDCVGWQTRPDIEGGPRGAARYPRVALDANTLRGVDRVLLSTEPYAFTADDARALAESIGIATTLIDGESVSWYGSRAIEGLARLATARVATLDPSVAAALAQLDSATSPRA